ncbi:MAG: DUF255 domain-containing protein [Bacteroidota bacterium]|nr:DUF255 domain-containing protein [Bacteroidota bacterium]
MKQEWVIPAISACVLFAMSTAGIVPGMRTQSPGERPRVAWKKYAEGREAARANGKKVLIDVYTTWCGWCRKMDREVYADSAVALYLDQHFVSVKLNAESAETHEADGEKRTEKAIAAAYGISSYPATVFLLPDGTPLTKVPGFIPRETFLHMLEYIATDAYKTTGWNAFLASKRSGAH